MSSRFITAALLLAGCGSAPPSTAADLAPVVVLDFAVAQQPPDIAVAACTPPRAGIYTENIEYTFVPAAGGTPTLASSSTVVAVRNAGSFERPTGSVTSASTFHCAFTSFDAQSCLAQCCPGQIASPLAYVDGGGWTLWAGGSCSFTISSGAQYSATVLALDGYFLR